MADSDEFIAWVQEGWRNSSRWQELSATFAHTIDKLAGDLKHVERQLWQALNDSDRLSDIVDLFHDALQSGDEADRRAAIDAYQQLRTKGLRG